MKMSLFSSREWTSGESQVQKRSCPIKVQLAGVIFRTNSKVNFHHAKSAKTRQLFFFKKEKWLWWCRAEGWEDLFWECDPWNTNSLCGMVSRGKTAVQWSVLLPVTFLSNTSPHMCCSPHFQTSAPVLHLLPRANILILLQVKFFHLQLSTAFLGYSPFKYFWI